jgi:hypothetical protein
MRARSEIEQQVLTLGGAAVGLRQRGLTWGQVGQGLGVTRIEARQLALAFIMRAAHEPQTPGQITDNVTNRKPGLR